MAGNRSEISGEKALFLFVLALAYGPVLGGLSSLINKDTAEGKAQASMVSDKPIAAADIVTGAMLDAMRGNAAPRKADRWYISDGMTIVSPSDPDQPSEEPDCEVACHAECPTYSDTSRPHN